MELRDIVARRLSQMGISQNELARRMGMDQAQLSRILSGQEQVKLSRLEDLARCLTMPLWRLFLEAGDAPDGSHMAAWIALYEALSPERRESALRLLSPPPPEQTAG